MSDEKKRVADALAALASGQHDDEQSREAENAEPIEAGEPAESAAEPPASAPPPRPLATPRPATPTDPPPVAKLRPRTPPPTPASATPLADNAMTETPPTRPASPGRPVSPVASAAEPAPVGYASPGTSSKTRRRRSATRSVFATLAFKRALIPICLVLGVGMPLLTVLWFTLDQDHPARKIGVFFPLVFLFVGLGVLMLGILVMFQVRDELQYGEAPSRRV